MSADDHRTRILLASSSPRRHELLTRLGLAFRAVGPDIDESEHDGEHPVAYVGRLARAKAQAITDPGKNTLIIAADTTVDVDGAILSKPADLDDARRMLRSLSGRSHLVHTGVAVRLGPQIESVVATTSIAFVPLDEAMINWYVAHEWVLDKAGAYALQGAGGAFVERVDGSVSNVIGLPLTDLVRLARTVGVDLLNVESAIREN